MGKGRQFPLISLESLAETEQNQLVNSPRSLEACKIEGIEPRELLYIPPEAFGQVDFSDQLQQLHYGFFEAKRKDIIALVRQTRQNLIEVHERSACRASSKASLTLHQKIFGSDIERAREKHIRTISKLLSYETTAAEKLQEQQRLEAETAKKEAKLAKKRVKAERLLAEERRLAELQRAEEALEEERAAKKATLNLMQQDLDESMKRHKAEKIEAKLREKRRIENEAQRMKHYQRMEARISELQAARELKLLAKQAKEEERERKLEANRSSTKLRLKSLTQNREDKRQRVIDKLESQIYMRRLEYEQSQEQNYAKHSRLMQDKALSISHIRDLSAQRDEKIAKTRKAAEKILEEKRNKILIKAEEADRKVEKQRRLIAEALEYKKHEETLQRMKKEWFVVRKRRKEEYLIAVTKEKMQEEERRVQQFLRDRDIMIKKRQELNDQQMLQKNEIRQALNKMAVTNKWDPDFLQTLRHDDHSTRTATTQKSRPRIAIPKTSNRMRRSLQYRDDSFPEL